MNALSQVLSKHRVKLLLLAAFVGLVYWIWVVDPKYTGYAADQPIPFSHKIHSGELGLDCQFCHVSVENGPHATVPDTATCMRCHEYVAGDSRNIQFLRAAYNQGEPIRWLKVHDLPDHVRFSHKAHVQHGFTCETCHGDVANMDKIEIVNGFNMGWCVNCHRENAHLVQNPLPQVGALGQNVSVHLTDCSTCHY